MDFSNCCRFCVKEIGNSTRNYLTQDLKDKFKYLTDLDLPDCDLYSNFSCSSCVNNLMMGIDIKENFINMQKFLQRTSNEFRKEANDFSLDPQTWRIKSEFEFIKIKEEPAELGNYVVQSGIQNPDLFHVTEDLKHATNNQKLDDNEGENQITGSSIQSESKTDIKSTKKRKIVPERKLKTSEKEMSKVKAQNTTKSTGSRDKKKRCDYCGKEVWNLKTHINVVHRKLVKYRCDVCGKGKNAKSKLQEHLNRHFNIRPNPCPSCDKSFVSAYALRMHIGFIHEKTMTVCKPKRKICELCGRSLSNITTYRNHKLTEHSDARDISCSYEGCTKKFAYQGALDFHIRHKHKPKFIECPICNKTIKHSLSSHMQRCHSERKFICDLVIDGKQCGKKYAKENELRGHVAISHQGFKKFICDMCDASYSKKMDLDNHRNVVHLKIKIKCELCPTLVLHHTELDETTKNALLEKIKRTPKEKLFNTPLSAAEKE